MWKLKTNRKITGVEDGNKKGFLAQELSEHSDFISPEELENYNKLMPDFGKRYLSSILEYTEINKTENDRKYHLGKVSIYVSIFAILFYLGVISFLFYIQQYKLGTSLMGLGIVALASITWRAQK